jgi:hypothetical protein
MENACMFYGHLEYFRAIWCTLWTFGNVVVIWYMFPRFWYIVSRKIWQPWWAAIAAPLKRPVVKDVWGRSYETPFRANLAASNFGQSSTRENTRGRFFIHFFQGKFRGKFSPKKCWDIMEFSAEKVLKNLFFSTNSAENHFPRKKNVRKIGPWCKFIRLPREMYSGIWKKVIVTNLHLALSSFCCVNSGRNCSIKSTPV